MKIPYWTSLVVLGLALWTNSASAQPTSLRLLNDNYDMEGTNEDLYVLFVGNPATVTSNGVAVSGVRNLALTNGQVSANVEQKAGAVPVSITIPIAAPSYTPPAPPFPILFTGQNEQYQVINYQANGTNYAITIAQDASASNSTWPPATTAVGGNNYYFQAGDSFQFGAYSQKFSDLHSVGQLATPSEYSGMTPNVYEASADLTSGALYFSKKPLTYIGGTAPSQVASTIPFQPLELTSGGTATSDLTAIDNFFLPLAIESVDAAGNAVDGRYFYDNVATINAQLKSIGAPKGTSGMYIGPAKALSAGQNTFPTFNYYNASISSGFDVVKQTFGVTTPNPTVVYGVNVAKNFMAPYAYSAAISGTTDFTITLTPDAKLGENTLVPDTSTADSNLYYYPNPSDVSSVEILLPASDLNDIIYGAILNSTSFEINMTSGSPSPAVPSGPFTVSSAISTTQFEAQIGYLNTDQVASMIAWFSASNYANVSAMTVNDDTITITTDTLTTAPTNGETFLLAFQAQGYNADAQTLNLPPLAPSPGNLNYPAPFKVKFLTGNVSPSTANVIASSGSEFTLQVLNAAGHSIDFTTPPTGNEIVQIIVDESEVFTQLFTNSSYSNAVADVLAAFNMGFVGTTPANSADWFASFPQDFPFGVAQRTNAYYNPWAAIFYNASDAYGFAFSDRVEPSPLMSTASDEDLWIWGLYKDQINAPLVKATASATSIELSWPAPDTSLTYSITATPGGAQDASDITYTGLGDSRIANFSFSNPIAASPYEFEVMAFNGIKQSLILPAYVTAAGTPSQITTGNPATLAPTWVSPTNPTYQAGYAIFQMTWNWFEQDANFVNEYDLYINQDLLAPSGTTPNQNFNVYAATGTNNYVFQVKDKDTVLYSWLMQVEVASISQTGGADTGTFTLTQTYPSASGNEQYAATIYGNPEQFMLVAPTGTPPTYNIQAQSAEPNFALTTSPVLHKEFAAIRESNHTSNMPLDKRPPKTQVDRDRIFTYHEGPAVNITGQAFDDSSLDHIEYSTDRGKTWENGLLLGGLKVPAGRLANRYYVEQDWELSLNDLEPGRTVVRVRAVDGEGNVSRPVLYGVNLGDNEAPRIAITNVDQSDTDRVTIKGTVYDNGRVTRVEYSTDDGLRWRRARLFRELGKSRDFYTFFSTDGGVSKVLFRAVDRDDNVSEPYEVGL